MPYSNRMNFFRKYIFPPLYGLLIYFTVRLLHDVERLAKFWDRPWSLNAIEMGCSVAVGYLGIWLFNSLINYFNKRSAGQFSYREVVKEVLIFVGLNLVLVNITLIPMAALTDDGLSWADVADIDTIPTLYAFIYYGIARSTGFLKAYIHNKIQLEKITNDHLQTELKFLKSQYHPHFLFNALNTIYFQMDEDLPGAKRSIEKFSELLRYQLYDQQQMVPIANELEYLQSYISLQQIRCSDKLQLQVDLDSALNTQLVYPLMFLPLVENAFKFIGGRYLMNLKAQLEDGRILFRVENSMPQNVPVSNKSCSGIGLENLKRRLELLYPEKHQLTTCKEGDSFIAEMILKHE